jgi:GAF domain-containing protein/CheY-like chemotaxis protein
MSEERLRVLLVDDEDSFRVSLQQYLVRTFGYEVDEAAMPAKARERVETAARPYDVALVDDLLIPEPGAKPQHIGIELIEDIRRRSPETECIVLTGWGKDRELAALEAGAYRYLAKPFDSEELALLIRTAAQQVRLRAIGRAILAERELDRVLDGIAGAACSLAPADEAAIVLLGQATGRLRIHAKTYPAEQQWWQHFENESLSREIIHTGRVERVSDTTQDRRVSRKVIGAGIRSFVGLPIPSDDGNLGVLYVYSYKTECFREWGTVAVLQTLAGQAGLAIANAHAFQQIRSHARYMDALVRAGQGLTEATGLQDQLVQAWEFVREQLQVSTFFVGLYDFQGDILRFPVAYEKGEQLGIADRYLGEDRAQWGISGYVVKTGQELVWFAMEEEWQLCAARGIQSIPVGVPPPQQTCFYLPLRTGDQIIGVMSIQSYARSAFSPILLDVFRALGSQLTVALENTRLLDAARRSSEQASALSQSIYEIGKEQDASTLLRSVVERAVGLLSAQGGGAYLLDPSGKSRALVEEVGLPLELKGQPLSRDEGLGGAILQTGKPQAVDDYCHWDKRLRFLDELGLTGVAGAPIRTGDRTLGALIVHDTRPAKRFDDEDLALLQQLANHAGLALQKVAMLDKLQAIQQVSTNITSLLEFQEVLNCTCRAAVELFGVDHSGLVLFDDQLEWGTVKGEFPAQLNTLGTRIRIKSVAAEEGLAFHGEPLLCHDLAQPVPELEPVRELLRGFDIRSICIVPITYQDRILGSFSLDAVGHTRKFTQEEIELCKVFATQVAVAIENARLFEATREGQAFVQSLYEATSAIISHTEPDQVLQAIVDTACATTGAWRAVVLLVDEGEQPKVLAQAGFDQDLEPATSIRPEGISRGVIRSGQPRCIPNVLEASREVHPAMIEQGVQAAACLPLRLRDKAIGVLWIHYPEARAFSQIEQHALQIYASQAAIAVENAQLYQETHSRGQFLATLDEASRHIRAERETSRLLHEIVRLAVRLVDGSAGCLFVHRPHLGELELLVAYNLPVELVGNRMSSVDGLVGQVAQTCRPQLVQEYANWSAREEIFEAHEFETAMAVPLEQTGQVEAVLWVAYGPDAPHPTATSLEVLERFAAQAAIAWQASRLMGREQRMLAQLGILHEISNCIQAAGNLDKILHVVLTGVTASYGLGFNRAALFLLDERGEYLVGRMGIGHLVEEQARQDWAADRARGLHSFRHYLELLEAGELPTTPVGINVVGLRFPARSKQFKLFMGEMCKRRCTVATLVDFHGIPETFVKAFEPASPIVVAPLMARGRPIGLLVADNKFTQAPVSSEDQEALLTFANTAAVAIENAQLYREASTGQERLRSFYEASNTLVSSRDVEQVLQEIVVQARDAAGASGAIMILIDKETGQVRQLITTDPEKPLQRSEIIRANGLSMKVLRSGFPEIIENCEAEQERVNPSVFWRKIAAALCVPVILEGQRIGVMWFHYSRPRGFLPSEIEAGQLYANQAALAYQSSRRITELEQMRQAAEALAGTAGLQEILHQIVKSARLVSQADSAAIWSYDEIRRQFIPEQLVFDGIPEGELERFRKMEPKEGGTAHTVMRQGRVAVTDIRDSKGCGFRMGPSTRDLLESIGARSFQGAALRVGDEDLGVLYVNYSQRRSFSEAECRTLETFANHAALALKNARLLTQMERVRQATEKIADVTVQEDLGRTLKTIARHICQVIASDAVTIYSYNEAAQVFDNWAADILDQRNPRASCPPSGLTSKSATQRIVDLREPPFYVIAEDNASEHELLGGYYAKAEGIRASYASQLRVGERKMGVMFVNFRSPHRLASDEIATIKLFADQAAVAIRNSQLYKAEQRYAQALEAVQETSTAASAVLDPDELLPMITEKAAYIFGAPAASLMLWDQPPECMIIRAAFGLTDGYVQRQRIARSVVEEITQKRGMIPLVLNIDREPLGMPELVEAEKLHSVLATPLMIGRQLVGILNIYSKQQPRRFDEQEKKLAMVFANHAAISIQNARAYAELKKTKGLVGARTSLAWMGMVSSSWRHAVGNQAITIRDFVKLARLDLDASASPDQIQKRLSRIDEVAQQIQATPITAPLGTEEDVTSISIEELIKERVKQLWGREPYKSVRLELELETEESATVRANPDWLRRAFDILIDNAVEAMVDAPTKQLTVSTRIKDGGLKLTIADTGRGIQKDVLQKLFQLPIPKPQGTKGLGAGLLMAHTIVETYGGDIGVGSTGPSGTTMIVWLPLERGIS